MEGHSTFSVNFKTEPSRLDHPVCVSLFFKSSSSFCWVVVVSCTHLTHQPFLSVATDIWNRAGLSLFSGFVGGNLSLRGSKSGAITCGDRSPLKKLFKMSVKRAGTRERETRTGWHPRFGHHINRVNLSVAPLFSLFLLLLLL